MRAIAVLAVLPGLAVIVAACTHDTRYQPKNDGRVHLVVQDGELAYERAGIVVPIAVERDRRAPKTDPFGRVFACDAHAADLHGDVRRAAADAERAEDVAVGLAIVGLVVPFAGMAAEGARASAWDSRERATAHAISAMNRFNDVDACTGRAPRPAPPDTAPAPVTPLPPPPLLVVPDAGAAP